MHKKKHECNVIMHTYIYIHTIVYKHVCMYLGKLKYFTHLNSAAIWG